MENKEKQVISKKRVADHGEVFTARREVDAMLDLVKDQTEKIDSTFLEPACGTGNFLIVILERKLAVIERKLAQKEKHLKKSEKRPCWKAQPYESDSLKALSSIYGIDILQDSIDAAKARLLAYFIESYQRIVEKEIPAEVISAAKFILDKNILLGDAINTQDKVTIPGVPGLDQIVFTEWSIIDGYVKRREFRYSSMQMNWKEDNSDDLLSTCDTRTHKSTYVWETGKTVLEPVELKKHPLTHFSNLI